MGKPDILLISGVLYFAVVRSGIIPASSLVDTIVLREALLLDIIAGRAYSHFRG